MEPSKTGKPVHIVMGSGHRKSHPLLLPKTGKRIVSKGTYAKAQGKRLLLCLVAAGFLFTAWIGFQLAVPVASTILHIYPALLYNEAFRLLVFFTLPILIGIVVFLIGRRGMRSIERAVHIDAGIPLTRANTADLSAPDSLVRASSEPLQAQEAVLLRAATEGQETPPEQLVRASVGQE